MPDVRSIGVVIPVFNEAGVVEQFHAQLRSVIDSLKDSFTVYYVDDGSTDGTRESLEKISTADPRVVLLELSRNFGHQAALTAGLDHALGDVVITMDADLRRPRVHRFIGVQNRIGMTDHQDFHKVNSAEPGRK